MKLYNHSTFKLIGQEVFDRKTGKTWEVEIKIVKDKTHFPYLGIEIKEWNIGRNKGIVI